MSRRRRSTGSLVLSKGVFSRAKARAARQAADIAAVDRGEVVTVQGGYHGDYGGYPHWRYMACWLDLAPEGPVIRPMVLLSFLWRRIPVEEQIVSVRVRPFRGYREALIRGAAGEFGEGGSLEHAGVVIVACETSEGTLEFTVTRMDVGLVLHYLNKLAAAAPPAPA